MNAKLAIAIGAAALLFLAVPTVAGQSAERAPDAPAEIRMRFNQDARLEPGESTSLLVVSRGNAVVGGEAGAVVVYGGTAELLPTARVGHLSVIRGTAVLRDGAAVQGDVQLLDSRMRRASGAVVGGEVAVGYWDRFVEGLRVFSLVIGLGAWLAVLLGGWLAMAVARGGMRRAGRMLTAEVGPTLLATVLLWGVAPVAAFWAMATLVGIPVGLGLFVFVLPVLGFLGYLVSGVRLGDALLRRVRGPDAMDRPYLAAGVGLLLLAVLGVVPVVGALVTIVAVMMGAGAVVLALWRGRTRADTPPAAAPPRAKPPAPELVVATH